MCVKSDFRNGFFVLHKVAIGAQKYSAWYDNQGNFLAAERIGKGWVAYPVTEKQVKVRAALQKIGLRHK
jgi:hypothetical protein